MSRKVIIVGAGASGLVAAGFLARRGAEVLVLEKTQRAASKVRISGKGRCNITNAMPIKDFPANYPGNGRFLYGALHRFSNQDCLDFFQHLGVEVKVERGQRVFPVSDDAHQVANALENFAINQGAEIRFGHKVTGVKLNTAREVAGVLSLVHDEERFFPAQAVIIATGGQSYPGTGSTGDGYALARSLGHEVIDPRPALVPVRVAEPWVKELSGLSLKNVELTVLNPQGGQKTYFGELMFAHFGLTGPIVLTASEEMGLWLKSSGTSLQGFIDLKPALSSEQLDLRLLRDLEKFANKQFANSLGELLPKSLIPVIIELSGIPPTKPSHQITKEERFTLGKLLKGLQLTITQTLPLSAAIVTAGGVNVKEIDPKTMESKLKKGVFFIGEVLDIHGVTGGFNLQAAFSTGYCAAQAVEL
ncbi:MAG: NAD(P)/FAD-dependent oxidoreductase [Firmicutes bacterium]|nr:NAD(P)/FAD-dependent oxidoreductase [Bacillota bacterium]